MPLEDGVTSVQAISDGSYGCFDIVSPVRKRPRSTDPRDAEFGATIASAWLDCDFCGSRDEVARMEERLVAVMAFLVDALRLVVSAPLQRRRCSTRETGPERDVTAYHEA